MKFDLALFEALNDEYRDRPIVNLDKLAERRKLLAPTPEDIDDSTQDERVEAAAKRQLTVVQRDVSVAGQTVLELGCGSGYLSRAMVDIGGAERVIGVDIERRETWDEVTDSRLTFLAGDLSVESLVEPASFDVVVSQVVFEHVTRPLQMLAAIRDVLKPGGTAWLRFNLYTAANASHRYMEVFFPWPHLLFEDEVVREFYERHHNDPTTTSAWINRMTVAHYLMVVQSLGLEIAVVRRRVTPIDLPFYLRFIDRLGRYPALDLETSFMTLVLRKQPQTELTDISIASINYLDRQNRLEERIALHQTRLRRAARLEAKARKSAQQ